MSRSTYVHGFIPPDDRFQKMLGVYRACEKAGVPIPEEVEDFFNGEPPDEAGVKISLTCGSTYKNAVKEYNDDDTQGYEVDLTQLPKDIKILRFLNS
jgi:hypothetical protein